MLSSQLLIHLLDGEFSFFDEYPLTNPLLHTNVRIINNAKIYNTIHNVITIQLVGGETC